MVLVTSQGFDAGLPPICGELIQRTSKTRICETVKCQQDFSRSWARLGSERVPRREPWIGNAASGVDHSNGVE